MSEKVQQRFTFTRKQLKAAAKEIWLRHTPLPVSHIDQYVEIIISHAPADAPRTLAPNEAGDDDDSDNSAQAQAAIAYQICDSLNAPVRVLDYFSAVAQGELIPPNPLPFSPDEISPPASVPEGETRPTMTPAPSVGTPIPNSLWKGCGHPVMLNTNHCEVCAPSGEMTAEEFYHMNLDVPKFHPADKAQVFTFTDRVSAHNTAALRGCSFCRQIQGHSADCWTVQQVNENERLRAEVAEWKALGAESPNGMRTVMEASLEGARTWQDLLHKAEAELAQLRQDYADLQQRHYEAQEPDK